LNIFANAPPATHCNSHPALITTEPSPSLAPARPGAQPGRLPPPWFSTAAPAAFTVTVVTSGGPIVAPKIPSRRSPPPTPLLPGAFTLALGALFFILVLRFYGESGGFAVDPYASRWKVVYAMVALAILVPFLFVADGCGGAATTPVVQKSSIVTPSGTSTLVITPTATNASGKALQMPLIQLTLTVN
jgi:hypothetical protein